MKREEFKQKYCEYLWVTQTKYPLTHCADHTDQISHDKLTRGLKAMDFDHRDLWQKVSPNISNKKSGYLVFDDTVIDKSHSHKIEMVRRQYSGNAHAIIKGIGIVNCVYVDCETGEETIINYRIYNIESDGKTKLDHVADMIKEVVENQVDFGWVLADTWYATQVLMMLIEQLGKKYMVPVKSNRNVDDSNRKEKMKRIDALNWTDEELKNGKQIHIKGFPAGHQVTAYRLEVTTNRTDYIVTNAKNLSQKDVKEKCAIRWKIEQFHRELKQLTGVEKCQHWPVSLGHPRPS